MPKLSLVPTFLREALGPRTLPREPEPDLVMDGAEQVAAYAEAGRIDGIMAAAYLFHTARISQVIAGARLVLDLGCGPATQLGQVAALNPASRFIGVDLSARMLANARDHAGYLGLANTSFVQADITDLSMIGDGAVDAVVSTMALHHLPSEAHLRTCLGEIRRVLAPGGALYLVDFGRLKSLYSVLFFAYMNRDRQPHLFSLDYERSLRAAFSFEDFARLAGEILPGFLVSATFKVPFLTVIKSADRDLDEAAHARLREMRRNLPRGYRRDLDELRMFFRLGGLRNDPFG